MVTKTQRTANLLGAAVLGLHDELRQTVEKRSGRSGEAPAAIGALGHQPGLSNDGLSQLLGLTHTGTVRLIDRLVADGLVERRPAARDKRGVALYLTATGKTARRKILEDREAALVALLSGLSAREQTTLAGLLEKLLIDVSRDLEDVVPVLRDLPVPVVFDHMGHMDATRGVDDPGFRALLRLLEGDRFWVKLSGNYRISTQAPGFADAVPIARALIAANPSRCVWGTDWPHPALTEFMPNDGDLLDALEEYAPDPETRRAILVDNPSALYGFS